MRVNTYVLVENWRGDSLRHLATAQGKPLCGTKTVTGEFGHERTDERLGVQCRKCVLLVVRILLSKAADGNLCTLDEAVQKAQDEWLCGFASGSVTSEERATLLKARIQTVQDHWTELRPRVRAKLAAGVNYWALHRYGFKEIPSPYGSY